MELEEELLKLSNQLDLSVKQLRKNGTERATKERDYKIKLREEALKLRADENMPVTLINQIIYGVPEVARMRFERDIAEAVYDANKEAINAIKLKLRIIEGQINREWGAIK